MSTTCAKCGNEIDLMDLVKAENIIYEIEEWYKFNKEEPIPYQRRPTKWDRLGIILRPSTPSMRNEE